MFPVLRMIEHCRMSCGADSRNASISPDLRGLCFKDSISAPFWIRLVSIRASANTTLMFLISLCCFKHSDILRL